MGCAENRGLLTASGKWAAADERGGPVEACSRSRGCRDAGKSLGRGCPFERPDPAWLSPVPEIFYGHMPQFPKRTGEGALWVGWGKGCICYWPEGRPEAGKVGASSRPDIHRFQYSFYFPKPHCLLCREWAQLLISIRNC